MLTQVGQLKIPIAHPVSISMEFRGKHTPTIDIDNASGAVLDSLVSAGILINDSIKFVPKLMLEYLPNFEVTGISVEIKD